MSTTFVFDYDETWSVDPVAFEAHVAFLMFRGHTCLIVTGRKPEHKISPGIDVPRGMQIIYCGGRPKRKVLAEHGFKGHIIFTDDMPSTIEPSSLLGGEL